jgi:hypothetical protein
MFITLDIQGERSRAMLKLRLQSATLQPQEACSGEDP